ncbi:MAG: methionyl-tRNA formyltransferase [Alphaproteobacteria bacterium]|nr:methionyl-tRNA formyltransferase [Alphaproteobacteria bacterium]
MTEPLRIAFMGSPDFAVPVLAALAEAGHEIACVYSQPPRPAGRGKKLRPTPVHQWADANGIEVRTPRSLKKAPEQKAFAALDLDAAIVVAYGLILPQEVLDAPRLGCMNMHASLLPRWRGAAPIHRAIIAGDQVTGVQAMIMEAGLDTGPVLATKETEILPTDTTGSVHDRLATLGADLAVTALAGLADGTLGPVAQVEDGATYAHKITAEDQRIDWTWPAAEVDCQIRGLSPFPSAWFYYTPAGETEPLRMKALMSRLEDGRGDAAPGTLLDDELLVQCGDGRAVRLLKAQKPGSKAMHASDLLRGLPISAGECFS